MRITRSKQKRHILFVYSCKDITDIKQSSIYQFIRDKQDAGLSNRYNTDILVLMKSVFKYAARTCRIPNPMDGLVMPKKLQTEIRLLTETEEQKLMQIVMRNRNLTTMGIAFAKMTGLRIGELCALKWADIDLEKRILTVRKTLQRVQIKSGKKKTKLMCSTLSEAEMAIYDKLDALGMDYKRADHDHADTMEDCLAIKKVLGAKICKNL